MKHLALCLILLLPAGALAETNHPPTFPNFTDVLLLSEDAELNIYVEGSQKDSISSLQDALDDLPLQKRREGVLLRFDPEKVPLHFAVDVSEQIYRCGVPVIYLYDATSQFTQSEIASSTYLFGLRRMPRYNRFLRVMDTGAFLLLPEEVHIAEHKPLPSRIGPVLGSLAVIVLACISYLAGLYISRRKKPWWMLGYLIPALLTLIIAIARWIPTLEMRMPFRLLMSERREYIVMSIATALLLAVPVGRVRRRLTAILATAFATLFVIHFSLLPYLLPAFNRTELLSLRTTFDRYGVCLQGTGYTCGPAAAVTALREFDIAAEEGELAVFAYSTSSAGTPPELLSRAIMELYDKENIECMFTGFASAAELRGKLPVIAVVKLGLLVDHYVTVLRVTEEYITVADPSCGMRVMPLEDFESEWRNQGIVVRRAKAKSRDGTRSIPIEPSD